MWKWLGILTWLVASNNAGAANDSTIKDLIHELKASHVDSSTRRLAEALMKQAPKTDEDVDLIVSEMLGPLAPVVQKTISNTENKELIPALMRGSDRLSSGFRSLSEEDFSRMSTQERTTELNRRLSLEALLKLMGSFRDIRAIPTLKKYLEYDSLQYSASSALAQMGDEEVFDYLLQHARKSRNVNMIGIKARHLNKIVEEIDDPRTDAEERRNLVQQIKGSRDASVNGILKELALSHQKADVRSQAGLALVNSILIDKSALDTQFIVNWAVSETNDEESDLAKVWVVYAMDKSWDDRFVPALVKILMQSRAFSSRSEAARVLGNHRVGEAIPYLEIAMGQDKEAVVRARAWDALSRITGEVYRLSHPEDIRIRLKYLREFPNQRGKAEHYEGE